MQTFATYLATPQLGFWGLGGMGGSCSQPSIFLYFYLTIKRMDRNVKELDTSAKQET